MHVLAQLRTVLIALLLASACAFPARAETVSLEVQASSVDRDKTTNEVVVLIELAPGAIDKFESFTERHVGRQIEIRLGTTVLLKARLVEKIKGGTIRATTKFTDDEGRKVSAQLTRGAMIILENVSE